MKLRKIVVHIRTGEGSEQMLCGLSGKEGKYKGGSEGDGRFVTDHGDVFYATEADILDEYLEAGAGPDYARECGNCKRIRLKGVKP